MKWYAFEENLFYIFQREDGFLKVSTLNYETGEIIQIANHIEWGDCIEPKLKMGEGLFTVFDQKLYQVFPDLVEHVFTFSECPHVYRPSATGFYWYGYSAKFFVDSSFVEIPLNWDNLSTSSLYPLGDMGIWVQGDKLWGGIPGNPEFMLLDSFPRVGSFSNYPTIFQNRAFFYNENGPLDYELWTTDGTVEGTQPFVRLGWIFLLLG